MLLNLFHVLNQLNHFLAYYLFTVVCSALVLGACFTRANISDLLYDVVIIRSDIDSVMAGHLSTSVINYGRRIDGVFKHDVVFKM